MYTQNYFKRRAIDLIEQEYKLNKQEKSETFKSVGIPLMMRVFNEINPMNNAKFERSSMPLTQKVLLCTILLCNKESKMKDIILSKVCWKYSLLKLWFGVDYFLFPTNKKLYDKFNKISETKMESESEFLNLCNLIQDSGLVDIKKAKEVRNFKVLLNIFFYLNPIVQWLIWFLFIRWV